MASSVSGAAGESDDAAPGEGGQGCPDVFHAGAECLALLLVVADQAFGLGGDAVGGGLGPLEEFGGLGLGLLVGAAYRFLGLGVAAAGVGEDGVAVVVEGALVAACHGVPLVQLALGLGLPGGEVALLAA